MISSSVSRLSSKLGRSGRRSGRYEDLSGDVIRAGGGGGETTSSSPDGAAASALGSIRHHHHIDPSDYDPAGEIELTAAAVAGVIPDDTFTVDQAVNNMGFGRFQVKLSLVTGLCWMADSMEMMILSIISPALHCSWGISSWQQALITTIVFLGMMISATFWGFMSDRYGRKTALVVSAIMLSYYGLLSSFAPNLTWILILRGLVGFGVGCVPQAVTLYAEFLPLAQRGKCVVLLESFWALGACFEVLLALFVMPTLGWQYLLALSSIPIFLFSMVCIWLPESARFHAASGNYDKALGILQRIADDNGKPMPLGRLILDDVQEMRRGHMADLLIPEFKRTTLLLWFIWMSCAFCYYGVVLMTTELFQSGDGCHGEYTSQQRNAATCHLACKKLQTMDYVDLLWTTLAEFPGIFLTIIIIEKLGRKKTMAGEFLIFTVFVFLLFMCTKQRAVLTFFLFMSRGIVSGVFQAAYVYTPEVYPTTLRAIGVGMCSAMARIGAMVTPFVAQVLLKKSIAMTISIYGCVGILAAVATMLLPVETSGREMKDRPGQR